MDACQQFLEKLLIAIQTKEGIDNPEIQAYLQYSGVQWNDQGDVSACLRDTAMNFIEVQVTQQIRLFQGQCLPQYCNEEWLNSHKGTITELINSQNTSLKITPEQMRFTEYPASSDMDYSSTSFVLITILFCAFVFLMVSSFLFSKFLAKKQKQRSTSKFSTTKSIATQSSSFPSMIVQQQNLEKPLLQNQNQKNDIETAINKLQFEVPQASKSEKLQKRRSLLFSVLDCWNLVANTEKICTISPSNSDLLAFNCIRVLSFMQVVLGHEFYIRMQYMSNAMDLQIIQANLFTLFVYSCLFAVDVFFFLGGFFVAYASVNPKYLTLFSFKKKLKVVFTFFFAVINRVSRILPSYFVAILLFWKYIDYFGKSPTWYAFIDESGGCDGRWWHNILFVQNLIRWGLSCFGWGWYLANDMQMFVYSLLLVVIYANNKFIGKTLIGVSLLTFQCVSFQYSYENNYMITVSVSTIPPFNYYIRPWTRSPPYLFGLLIGIFYKEYQAEKEKDKQFSIFSKIKVIVLNSLLVKWSSYAIGLVIIFVLMLGPHPLQTHGIHYWSDGIQNFWQGSCRIFYVFGVFLVLLPGMCGSKDLLVRFMSSKIFQFLAKLTFSGYLIHYIVLSFSLWGFDDSLYVNTENIIQLYASELVITLFLSFVFVICIEQPFSNLANLFFNASNKKSGQQHLPKQNPMTDNVSLHQTTMNNVKEITKNIE